MTYRSLARVHRFIGLFAAPFVLLYGLTALQMVHNVQLPSMHDERDIQIDPAAPLLPALARDHGVWGRVQSDRQTRRGRELTIDNPKRRFQIRLQPGGHAALRIQERHWLSVLPRMHQLVGLNSHHPAWNLWGLWVLVHGAALVALAVTGIAMWIRRLRERRLGLIFIVASAAYAVGLLVAIRCAG